MSQITRAPRLLPTAEPSTGTNLPCIPPTMCGSLKHRRLEFIATTLQEQAGPGGLCALYHKGHALKCSDTSLTPISSKTNKQQQKKRKQQDGAQALSFTLSTNTFVQLMESSHYK